MLSGKTCSLKISPDAKEIYRYMETITAKCEMPVSIFKLLAARLVYLVSFLWEIIIVFSFFHSLSFDLFPFLSLVSVFIHLFLIPSLFLFPFPSSPSHSLLSFFPLPHPLIQICPIVLKTRNMLKDDHPQSLCHCLKGNGRRNSKHQEAIYNEREVDVPGREVQYRAWEVYRLLLWNRFRLVVRWWHG